jgi:hypothetical protein
MAIVQTGQGHLAELSTLEPSDRVKSVEVV